MKRNNGVFFLVSIIVLTGCGEVPEPDLTGPYPHRFLGKRKKR